MDSIFAERYRGDRSNALVEGNASAAVWFTQRAVAFSGSRLLHRDSTVGRCGARSAASLSGLWVCLWRPTWLRLVPRHARCLAPCHPQSLTRHTANMRRKAPIHRKPFDGWPGEDGAPGGALHWLRGPVSLREAGRGLATRARCVSVQICFLRLKFGAVTAGGVFHRHNVFLACRHLSTVRRKRSCANISARFQCKQIFRSSSRIPPLVTPGGVIHSHKNC